MPPALLHRAAILLTLITILGACGGGTGADGKDKTTPPPPPKERLTIVCTTPIVREMIAKIAGDKVDIHCLMRPGHSTAHFDLNPGDVQLIQAADLVFSQGARYEKAVWDAIIMNVRSPNVITDLLDGGRIVSLPHYRLLIERATAELCTTDPKNEPFFTAGSEAYLNELRELGKWITAIEPTLAADTGGIITNQAVVVDLARIIQRQATLHPIDAVRQPTLADRDKLLAAMKESKARAIAIDPGNNQALAEMLIDLAKATGARIVSPAITEWPREDETYITWMKANIETLAKAMK